MRTRLKTQLLYSEGAEVHVMPYRATNWIPAVVEAGPFTSSLLYRVTTVYGSIHYVPVDRIRDSAGAN